MGVPMTPSEVMKMQDNLETYFRDSLGLAVGDSEYAAHQLILHGWVTSEPGEAEE